MRSTIALIAATLAACGTTGPPRRDLPPETVVRPPTDQSPPAEGSTDSRAPDPAAERLWREAEEAGARGDRVRRLERLTRLAATGVSKPAQAARVELAEEAVADGRFTAAKQLLRAVDDESLRGRRLSTLALAFEGEGDFPEAEKTWRDAAKAGPPAGGEAAEGAARARFLGGDPDGAVETLKELSGQGTEEDVRRIVAPKLHGQVLAQLYGKVPSADPWSAWIALQHARERWTAGDMVAAGEAAARARSQAREPLTRSEADALLAKIAAWQQVTPRTLGVLLPLSGKYQRIGQAALEAIQLSVASHPDVRLVVRDTRGDADEAARQAEALVLEQHVSAILGPVGEKEARAAGEVAGRLSVPHLLLASKHDVAADLDSVFRLRMSRNELGAALARYAYQELGVRRAAILFPDDASGFRYMASFWDELVRLGGEIRAVESYVADTKDFNPVVKRLIGAGRPGSGTHDFDALFVPDQALAVRRLVPFLKYWDIQVKTEPWQTGRRSRPAVQLLGASGWNHPAVIDRGDNLTDNAVFVAPFFPDPDDPASAGFAAAFSERYSKPPLAFHAEVHDAAAVVVRAVAAIDGSQDGVRERIIGAIKSTRGFQGATGSVSVQDDGSVVRTPRILTIDLDTIRVRRTEPEETERRKQRFPSEGPR